MVAFDLLPFLQRMRDEIAHIPLTLVLNGRPTQFETGFSVFFLMCQVSFKIYGFSLQSLKMETILEIGCCAVVVSPFRGLCMDSCSASWCEG